MSTDTLYASSLVLIGVLLMAVALLGGCANTIDRAVDGTLNMRTNRPGGCITLYQAGRKEVRCDRSL